METHIDNVPIITLRSFHKFGNRISAYKGMVIVWSEESERVLHTIDTIPKKYYKRIIAIQVHKGVMFILWKSIPKNVPDGIVAVDGDYWGITNLDHSKGEEF